MKKILVAAGVALVSASGVLVQPQSAPARAATPSAAPAAAASATSATSASVRVASFNVQSVSLDRTSGNQRPWRTRRAGVIADILSEKVDVVGVQEANASRYFASRLVSGATQMHDLKNGLNKAGGSYQLTNWYPYNCVNYWTTYKCVARNHRTSGGNRILFNTRTLSLVTHGATRFTQTPGADPRYIAWAVLRVKATGRDFLFVNTHLNAGPTSMMRSQWRQLISRVNQLKGSRPVVVVGDFNIHRLNPLSAELLPAMKRAGFGDVLSQQYQVRSSRSSRARSVVNGWINTYNHLSRDVAAWSYEDRRSQLGINIDYIFASNAIPVQQWKVVVDYHPSTLRVRGTFPSDHNMVRATLTLR